MRLQNLFSDPLMLVISIVTVIIALSIHECAHAYAAYKLGDPTAKLGGRMTLDPLAHLDIMGFICMVVLGFGWAKPVPVNPRNFKNMRVGEIVVSLAGITANFLLAFITLFIGMAVLRFTSWNNPVFMNFIMSLTTINIALMVFNLLPIPPLDGYHFAKNMLIGKVSLNFFWTYERYGQFILLGLIFFGAVSGLLSTVTSGIYTGMFSVISLILF